MIHKCFKITLYTITCLTFSGWANAKTYTGTVVPLRTANIKGGADTSYWGSLYVSPRIGMITKPNIVNLSGKEISHGTLLTNLKEKYFKGLVLEAKGELIAAKKNMIIAYNDYIRYQKLYPKGTVPVKDYQKRKANFYDAISTYKRAKAKLLEQNRYLAKCKNVSPIEGIVTKVSHAEGILVGNPEVLTLAQLNPIGIKVKMPENEAAKISISTPVSISFNGRTEGIWNGNSILCKDGIIFKVKNSPVRNSDLNIPRFRNCYHVEKFYLGYSNNDALGVPLSALHKDNKGYYVWKGKNRKFLQPGKGLDPLFHVEKVYVVPGKLKRLYNAISYLVILKSPGNLQKFDLVIADKIETKLKNNDLVSFLPERYNLMPGDKVKVNIE